MPLRIVAEFKARASDLEGLHAEFVERASRSLDDGVQLVSWRSLVLRWSIVVVDQSRAFFSRTEEPGGGATARRLGRDELALPPRVDDDRLRPAISSREGATSRAFTRVDDDRLHAAIEQRSTNGSIPFSRHVLLCGMVAALERVGVVSARAWSVHEHLAAIALLPNSSSARVGPRRPARRVAERASRSLDDELQLAP